MMLCSAAGEEIYSETSCYYLVVSDSNGSWIILMYCNQQRRKYEIVPRIEN